MNRQHIIQGNSETSYLQITNMFGDKLIDVMYCAKSRYSFFKRVKIALGFIFKSSSISRATFYLDDRDIKEIKELLEDAE